MIHHSIVDYFLDKPGTYEDENSLNLASEKILQFHNDVVDIKLNQTSVDAMIAKGHHIKTIKTEGNLKWQQIPINEISMTDLYELIDLSYESVIHTLSEAEQKEILDLEW